MKAITTKYGKSIINNINNDGNLCNYYHTNIKASDSNDVDNTVYKGQCY